MSGCEPGYIYCPDCGSGNFQRKQSALSMSFEYVMWGLLGTALASMAKLIILSVLGLLFVAVFALIFVVSLFGKICGFGEKTRTFECRACGTIFTTRR